MPDLWVDVDVAAIIPVNIMPIVDATDFKSIEDAVAYDGIASGTMELVWNFMPCSGTVTAVAVTPTTASNQDWVETVANRGMYSVEMPAAGGADFNNNTEGVGWFTGEIVGALPFRGPTIGFRKAALNNSLLEGATVDVNATAIANGVIAAATFAAGAINAAAIAAGAIDNATFAADVGSTAYATNILALAVAKALAEMHVDDLGTDWLNGGRLDLILDTAAGAGARTLVVEDTVEIVQT